MLPSEGIPIIKIVHLRVPTVAQWDQHHLWSAGMQVQTQAQHSVQLAQVTTAAWFWSLAWELHVLWGRQKKKKKKKKRKKERKDNPPVIWASSSSTLQKTILSWGHLSSSWSVAKIKSRHLGDSMHDIVPGSLFVKADKPEITVHYFPLEWTRAWFFSQPQCTYLHDGHK